MKNSLQTNSEYQQKQRVQKLKKLFKKTRFVQVNENEHLPKWECSELNYFAKS